eukprot:gene3757-5851_t
MSVRCQHLLVKWKGSRNPVSRRTNKGTDDVSEEAAKAELDKYLTRAKAGEDFGALCNERSDCGSYASNGDLGFFSKGQMQKPFEEATFALQ